MHVRRSKLKVTGLVVGAILGPWLGADWGRAGTITVRATGFTTGAAAINAGTNQIALQIKPAGPVLPFCQSAVKQGTEPALLGPDPKIPYFTVRFAMPIPPENGTNLDAAWTGLDPEVFTHNHSPGFELLPNGDALAIYFSTPPDKSESDPATSFVQARLRYGAEEWDLPELFYKFENYNDQSGLLWNDRGTLRFFGGGRGASDWLPFKLATSTDNGASWILSLPQLDQPATDVTPQPITSAFRGANGSIYFAMDGAKSTGLLWCSPDNGLHWHDMGGRTGARHSPVIPLDDHGDLLSVGGKNASVNGWAPESVSTNWGASWSKSQASPFPALGNVQRPSLIRLADHDLLFTSDAYMHKRQVEPPAGWKYGDGCFVALSADNGATWHVKSLPVQLPNHQYRKYGTLGYVTARQAPNGVIHILTTETQPCLDYELNEAWILSDAGDVAPEDSGGVIRKFSEQYPDGKLRSEWSARICPHGRYLLDGPETDYYENGSQQHVVTYAGGRKTGGETFWGPDGAKVWSWSHDLKQNTGIWTQYWPNGRLKSQSAWNTRPEARDLARSFFGYVANGAAYQWAPDGTPVRAVSFTNGLIAGTLPLPKGEGIDP